MTEETTKPRTKWLLKPKPQKTDKKPILKIKILDEDLNHYGMVKGEVVFKVMEHSKQSLAKIMGAFDAQELQVSLAEIIEEMAQSRQYTKRDVAKEVIKALKKTYPSMMKTDIGAQMKTGIKHEVNSAFYRSDN